MSDINVQTFSGKVNVTNNLLVGSSHLFVDTVGNKVGITTASPDAGLHVNSNAYVNTDFRVGSSIIMNDTAGQITAGSFVGDGSAMTGINSDSGSWVNGTGNVYLSTTTDKVGIGTSDPEAPFNVVGNNALSGTPNNVIASFRATTTDPGTNDAGVVIGSINGNTPYIADVSTASLGLSFYTQNDERMRINSSGNVGIGTTNPTESLQINSNGTDPTYTWLIGSTSKRAGIAFSEDASSKHTIIEYDGTGSGAENYLAIYSGTSGWTSKGDGLNFIPSNGRVGIGTTSPGKKLEIAHGYQSLGGYIDTYRVSGVVGGTVLGTRQGGGTHVDAIHITDSAWIGIGLNNPGIITSAPNVNRTVHVVGRYVVSEPGDDEHWSISTANHFDLKRSINGTGYIDAARIRFDTGAYNDLITFTGQHRGVHIKNISPKNAHSYEGLIVCANRDEYESINGVKRRGNEAITVNEAVPLLRLSSEANDKTCFGVISDSEDSDTRTQIFGNLESFHYKMKGDEQIFINSLGEGGIWVVNSNGTLESGDYITTSSVAGYGMKQDDDLLHNYTVAKITMNCDFDPISKPKKRLVQCEELVVYYLDENNNVTTEENAQSTREKMEYVNVLDEHGQLQWEDTEETEKAYKVRYLLPDGTQISEEEYMTKALANEEVYIAAFVGCTYHCG